MKQKNPQFKSYDEDEKEGGSEEDSEEDIANVTPSEEFSSSVRSKNVHEEKLIRGSVVNISSRPVELHDDIADQLMRDHKG